MDSCQRPEFDVLCSIVLLLFLSGLLGELGEHSFNEDLSGWDTSSATTMRFAFQDAGSFRGTGLQYWDVGNVEEFRFM